MCSTCLCFLCKFLDSMQKNTSSRVKICVFSRSSKNVRPKSSCLAIQLPARNSTEYLPGETMDCSRQASLPWDFPGKNIVVGCHFFSPEYGAKQKITILTFLPLLFLLLPSPRKLTLSLPWYLRNVYLHTVKNFYKNMNKLLGFCGKFYLELLLNYSALFLKNGG